MITLMSGTRLNKVGPHFDMHGVMGLSKVVASTLGPQWVELFWTLLPTDLRPSALAKIAGTMIVSLEVCVPFLLLSRSKVVVRAAVVVLVLMHLGIYCCVGMQGPLAYLQIWCVTSWIYLFLGGDRDGPMFGFDYAGAKVMP